MSRALDYLQAELETWGYKGVAQSKVGRDFKAVAGAKLAHARVLERESKPVSAAAIRAIVEGQVISDPDANMPALIPGDRIEPLIKALIYVLTGEQP